MGVVIKWLGGSGGAIVTWADKDMWLGGMGCRAMFF